MNGDSNMSPNLTLGNTLLLYTLFGVVGSLEAVLPETSWDVEELTTGSMGDCLPGTVLGLEMWMGYKLGLNLLPVGMQSCVRHGVPDLVVCSCLASNIYVMSN